MSQDQDGISLQVPCIGACPARESLGGESTTISGGGCGGGGTSGIPAAGTFWQWASGICDCCDDVPECCFAFWCCPCFACKTTKAYGQCLCLPMLEIFMGVIPPITMSMRVSMRERYGIKGTMCNDCLCATCCTSCVWCQMSREMKRRKIQVLLVSAKNT